MRRASCARQYEMYMRPSAASSDCEIVFYEIRLLRQLGTPLLYHTIYYERHSYP